MSDIVYLPRPCDRCGAGTFDTDYTEDKSVITPMCAEVHITSSVITWLCFNCRRAWHRTIDEHSLAIEYEESSFIFENWKIRVNKDTTDAEVEKGLELYRKMNNLERQINNFANEWLLG